MSDHTTWRIHFADKVGQLYQKFSGVRVILIGGSVARGYCDPRSDVEVGVFWGEAPTEEIRRQVAEDLGATFITDFETYREEPKKATGTEDNLLIKGVQIDVCHNPVKAVEQTIFDVCMSADTRLAKQGLMATLMHGIPLYGADVLEKWKGQIDYSEKVAKKIINEHLPHLFATRPLIHIERQDYVMYNSHANQLQRRLGHVVFALNRIWYCLLYTSPSPRDPE